jgi:glycine C-acetyltransferase
MGKRYVFKHNDIADCEKQLERATKLAEAQNGSILLITEGVFGMRGDQGKLKEIVELKKKFKFRLFVDDAHGIGTLGKTGGGTGQEQGCQDGIDIYFGTFAKSFALIGGFISSEEQIVEYLRYNMRSQIFAKALPMPLVVGALKRIELMRNKPELKDKLWEITNALQSGLKEAGFEIGDTNSCVTPVYMNGSIPEATNLILDLRENFNIFCSMVVYPVVPKGMIILRLIPTAAHTMEDVKYTIECFSKIVGKLKAGQYMSDKIAAF